MQVIDNFLDETYFQKLKDTIFNSEFAWNYSEVSVYNSDDEINDLTNHQFIHILYQNSKPCSKYYDHFESMFAKLRVSVLLRAKLNLNVNIGIKKEKPFHTDIPVFMAKNINYTTGIFYFNDNDGYTKFKDDTIVESISNRLVIFNGNIPHCGSTCTNKKNRVVLNLNWI